VGERDFDILSHAGGDHRAVVWEREISITETVLTAHFPFVRVIHALVYGTGILA
jgi:hypothetical protein